MKIAMIGHKTVPSRDGGVEVAVESLAVCMAERGHDVTVYNRGGKIRKEEYRGIHIRRVPVLPFSGLSAAMGSLFATVRAVFGGFDCIHLHAEGIANMSFLPRWMKKRTIVTVHGLDWKRSKWGRFASWYLKRGERAAVRNAHEIIVLSEAMRRYFLDSYGRATVYIPNGMERREPTAPDLILQKWNLEQGEYLLYLGRLVPEKRALDLVRAFRQVYTDKKLVIAGNPLEMEDYFQQLQEAAAGDKRIIFAGFVEGQLLHELHSNCYLYCLPSELEGMPISLLEALSHGSCCVCSDIPECTEVVGDFGFSFPAGDRDALRRLLERLCREPETVKASRERVRQGFAHYTWDEVTERTLALYEGAKV